ncbi:uroporphyrinogen-III synthase [uncultured Helicobacter sp.]|uniref:uroporphyrinogen-III synthase n=1 Tax=uncultured Helicobacter sp. TaxID=175537 RepID=UPI002606E326|nr:uroporphyrinogen-III synthase [uncultured Helicobacter sp.]
MVYYITKTNPNLAHLPLDERILILPLITLKTKFVENIQEKLQACDSLIFTSKNAIYALNENLKSKNLQDLWKSLPNFVIGKGSANALEFLELKAEFIASNAYGEVFVNELIPLLKEKKPLFVRAKKIASKIPEVLRQNGISFQEVIIYENLLNTLENPPKLKKDSIVVFGAPSHIQAFLLNFTWDCSFCALCIGKTTSNAAKELLGEEAKILQSPKPEFKSTLEFALKLESNI